VGDPNYPERVRLTESGRSVAAWDSPAGPPTRAPTLPLPGGVRGTVLDAEVAWGRFRETSSIFVPDLGDWRPPLYPAELGAEFPRTEEGVLDTLTVASSPHFHPGPAGAPDLLGSRGLLVTPLRDDRVADLRAFLEAVLTTRFRHGTPRPWGFLALALFAASWSIRPEGRRGVR
jgi:hypothetical protein